MVSAQRLGKKELLYFPHETRTFLPEVVIFNEATLTIKRPPSSHCAKVDRNATDMRSKFGRGVVEFAEYGRLLRR